MAQADEDGFSFLSEEQIHRGLSLREELGELRLGPRVEIGIGLDHQADWLRGSEMEPGHQAWTLEPVAGVGVVGAGTVESGSIGRIVPTARGGGAGGKGLSNET